MLTRSVCSCVLLILLTPNIDWAAQQSAMTELSIRTCDGNEIRGTTKQSSISVQLEQGVQEISFQNLLSFHSAQPATEFEHKRIEEDLNALDPADLAKAESAAAELADIGLPVITPLLQGFQDTDGHEPDYRYRLFGRIIPGRADGPKRTAGLVRLADETILRADLADKELHIADSAGHDIAISAGDIRRIAVRKKEITRTLDLEALHHCTYVGFMDCGILVTPESSLICDAQGYVRLSFDEDGWASDPSGILDPLPGKRRMQEGFRWGSLLGKVGPAGQRFYVGKHAEKSDLGEGRLYLVINDNEHWQNNIGSYRVTLVVKNAFDVGDAY